MVAEAELDRLAELVGIEPFYWDIWGNRIEIAAETKRDLIAAMGLSASGAAEVAASLRAVEEQAWRRMLAPVTVLDAGVPGSLTFTVPDRPPETEAVWTFWEENGATRSGRIRLADLVREADHELEGTRFARYRLPLPEDLPEGYHRLTLDLPETGDDLPETGSDLPGAGEGSTVVIVAPERCLSPDELMPGGRSWGFAAQLYGLRGAGNWGIGDFGDLGRFAEVTAGLGASVVGLSPLHALFPADPTNCSPYSPSSRSFLSALFIDVAMLPELAEDADVQARVAAPDFQAALARVREADFVDYPAVAALKLPVLEALHASFRRRHLGIEPTARGAAFRAFQAELGEDLHRHAVYDALHDHFLKGQGIWSWRDWPEGFRHPESPEVVTWVTEHAARVEFFAWLQWLADDQLGTAAARARAAGMAIGFYRDLAVADNPAGAAAWAGQGKGTVLSGAAVGAPGDMFSPKGQNWGLAPLSPVGLRERAYQPFIAVLRANMRHAGAVRIDHAMALQHLFWIPSRPDHAGGAYVRYPLHDLLRIVALESRRNRCLVIGEDLGTVPEGFRPALQRTGILSYKVLYFERGPDQGFIAPEHYPAEALVAVTTHDLPTLKGFWTGHDQDWRTRLHLYPSTEIEARERAERRTDRHRLLGTMRWAGLLPPSAEGDPDHVEMTPELAAAVHRLLARTPGRIMMVQVEDALGEVEQPNLPGTTDEHPNWRRKLPVPVESLAAQPSVRGLAEAIGQDRPALGRG